jgi:hypothetical protein
MANDMLRRKIAFAKPWKNFKFLKMFVDAGVFHIFLRFPENDGFELHLILRTTD